MLVAHEATTAAVVTDPSLATYQRSVARGSAEGEEAPDEPTSVELPDELVN